MELRQYEERPQQKITRLRCSGNGRSSLARSTSRGPFAKCKDGGRKVVGQGTCDRPVGSTGFKAKVVRSNSDPTTSHAYRGKKHPDQAASTLGTTLASSSSETITKCKV